jgi:hypothetical protein
VPIFVRHAPPEALIKILQSEIDALRELETRIPVVRQAARWSLDYPERHLRNKMLFQIALIHASLLECTQETVSMLSPLLGRKHSLIAEGVTASENFVKITNQKIQRVWNGDLSRITK